MAALVPYTQNTLVCCLLVPALSVCIARQGKRQCEQSSRGTNTAVFFVEVFIFVTRKAPSNCLLTVTSSVLRNSRHAISILFTSTHWSHCLSVTCFGPQRAIFRDYCWYRSAHQPEERIYGQGMETGDIKWGKNFFTSLATLFAFWVRRAGNWQIAARRVLTTKRLLTCLRQTV